MRIILILTSIFLAVAGPIQSPASEPEPNWTNRYQEIKQQLLNTMKPPAAGQTVTIIRHIGGGYTGLMTSITSNYVVVGGNRYEPRQLTDETCDKFFPESGAVKLARQQVIKERDAFREVQETERRKADEAAQLKAKAEEEKRIADGNSTNNLKVSITPSNQPRQAARIRAQPASPPLPDNSDSNGQFVLVIVGVLIAVVVVWSLSSRRLKLDASGRAMCPKCGSTSIGAATEGSTKGFSAGQGCCGWILLGPFGFLCGLCGSGKGKFHVVRMCMACGKKF